MPARQPIFDAPRYDDTIRFMAVLFRSFGAVKLSRAKIEEKCAASTALRLCIYIFVLKQQDNLYL